MLLVTVVASRALAADYYGPSNLWRVEFQDGDLDQARCWWVRAWYRRPSNAGGIYKIDMNGEHYSKHGAGSCPNVYPRPAGYLSLNIALTKRGSNNQYTPCVATGTAYNSPNTWYMNWGAATTGCGAGTYKVDAIAGSIWNGEPDSDFASSPTFTL